MALPGMNPFWDLIAIHPFLGLLHAGLTVWLLIDAYRRQADYFWFFVIFFVPLAGAAAYFFVMVLPEWHSVRNLNFAALLQRRASLDELTYRAEQTPTLTNHLALAQRLMELKRSADA